MPTFGVKLELSQEVAGYIQDKAGNRGLSLEQVVSDVWTDYFAEITEDEILESIRNGMRQAL